MLIGKNQFSYTMVFWGLMCLAGPLPAESELDYMVGMSIGVRNTEFDLTSVGGPAFFILGEEGDTIIPAVSGSNLNFSFDQALYTASFSGAVIYDRFHISAALEVPIRSEDTSMHTEQTFGEGDLSETDDRDVELDRIDFSVTLGYRVWEGLSVFSGYKYTEFDIKSQEYNFVLNDKNHKYVEDGLFLGTSYVWTFAARGSLSVSIAYANLDAEFSEDNVAPQAPDFELSFGEFAYSGNATGLSYGAQWSGRLVKNWLYTVNIKHQSYKSKNNATKLEMMVGDNFISQHPDISIPVTATPIAVTEIDSEHTDTIFSVGLLYVLQ
jgi:hypothetical protein